MEELLKEITQKIRDLIYENMPYDPKDKEHIRDVALDKVPVGMGTLYYFDIGNENAEQNFPYYHILEDAEVIRKRGRSDKRTRGSQASLPPKDRDYGKWTTRVITDKNGVVKSVKSTQEYRKENLRGSRSKISQATDYRYQGTFTINGKDYKTVVNQNADSYVNRHYHYIERILDDVVVNELCNIFGLKAKRKQITKNDIKEIEQGF